MSRPKSEPTRTIRVYASDADRVEKAMRTGEKPADAFRRAISVLGFTQEDEKAMDITRRAAAKME